MGCGCLRKLVRKREKPANLGETGEFEKTVIARMIDRPIV